MIAAESVVRRRVLGTSIFHGMYWCIYGTFAHAISCFRGHSNPLQTPPNHTPETGRNNNRSRIMCLRKRDKNHCRSLMFQSTVDTSRQCTCVRPIIQYTNKLFI